MSLTTCFTPTDPIVVSGVLHPTRKRTLIVCYVGVSPCDTWGIGCLNHRPLLMGGHPSQGHTACMYTPVAAYIVRLNALLAQFWPIKRKGARTYAPRELPASSSWGPKLCNAGFPRQQRGQNHPRMTCPERRHFAYPLASPFPFRHANNRCAGVGS